MKSKNSDNLNVYLLEQIADIVWLSTHIPFDKKEGKKREDKFEDDDTDIDDIEGEYDTLDRDNVELDELIDIKSKNRASLYAKEGRDRGTDIKGDPIRTPKKLSLSNHREWERSFRRLRYRVDSSSRFVLDEPKTVDIIAQTEICQLILKGKRENFFSLSIIIDQSHSMEIWSELIEEFKRTIQRFGLFNNILFYYLDTNSEKSLLFSDKRMKTKINHKQLAFGDRKNLILILSDCVSPAWRSNHLFELIDFWSQYALTSIVQMFPKRMWRITALDNGYETSFSSTKFNPLNKHLRDLHGEDNPSNKTVNIPIIAFEPTSFGQWGEVIFGRQERWIDGTVIEDFEVVTKLPPSKVTKISAEEREERYRFFASPLAKELAIYASIFPINFEIIRMLQELKLPNSNQSHLAEFFLGGLIRREEQEDGVHYDFYDGVREILRQKLGAKESFKIWTMISRFVAENMNSALDFQALIYNPNAINPKALSENDIAFANICVDVLKRFGGRYDGVVEGIKKGIYKSQRESIKPNEEKKTILETIEIQPFKNEYLKDDATILDIGTRLDNNRYEIIDILGKGGFGIVYRVKRVSDNKFFAIKELFISSSAVCFRNKSKNKISTKNKIFFNAFKEKVKKEVDFFSKEENKNSNIVDIYGFFEENNTVYTVMEYINGYDLEQLMIDEKKSFTEQEILELLRQIFNALTDIHNKNTLHRDIKPSNIMQTDNGIYKLIDFTNIKIFLEEERGIITEMAGLNTKFFSPPELISKTNNNIGVYSDIYSLGITIYCCLSGKFDVPDANQRQIDDTFQNKINALDISNKLKDIIIKMTQLNPKDRYQSVGEIEDEINPLNIYDFPQELLFLDEIDVNDCIFDDDNKTTIDVVVKQIWKGSRSLIDRLILMGRWFDLGLNGNQCNGIKDILLDWEKDNLGTFIFYIPKSTIKEIKRKMAKRVSTNILLERIENYIFTKCRESIPNISVYSLNNESSELNNIFDIWRLKEALDYELKGKNKIYFMGLKFNLNANNKVGCYLNNTPIREESGLIIGNSNILRHKLKKGYMSIYYDEEIEIEFFDTNMFSSKNEDVDDDLRDIDFERDSIDITLDYYNTPLILESTKEKSLIFEKETAIEKTSAYYPKESKSIVKSTKINMDSFFIPKAKDLKGLYLLLLEKDGQKILVGGQYYDGLIDFGILAEIFIDFEEENITITNYSNEKMSFLNYDNDFFRLEEEMLSSKYHPTITELVSIDSIEIGSDSLTEISNPYIEPNIIIDKEQKHTFAINEIEFNDSNVSFDKNGVLIRYSSFTIAEFEKEFALHRTSYKLSERGTMIDLVVNQPSKGVFEYGARVYEDKSSILGVIISSQPIYLKHTEKGLEIDATSLVARSYIVKILASDNTYILEDKYNAKKTIKKNEMKNVEIEVMTKNLKQPLIAFSLEFD